MSRLRFLPASALVLISLGGVARADILLDDPLSGSTTGNQVGGQFAGGGWQAGFQIWWDLGSIVTAGWMSVDLTNWNPNSDSAQHQYDKQHIINMYEYENGSPHESDAMTPKGSFFNVRTGATYDNFFKFLSTTSGFDAPPAGRLETRIPKPLGFIDPANTYTIKIEWTGSGDITAYLDGMPQVTHSHLTPLRLRYVFIGSDNAPAGTYGPQKDVIYKNVKVWGTTTSSGGAGGASGAGGTAGAGGAQTASFEPVADTWSEPINPTAIHGADPELRAGGDGRTIYLRFDVKGVTYVKSAKIFLEAMNGGGGGDLHSVSDNTWSEATLTHENRPLPDPAILGSLGTVQIGGFYSFDVTSVIQADGLYSFAIASTEIDGCGYYSKESTASHPELVIETMDGPAGSGAGASAGTGGGAGSWQNGGASGAAVGGKGGSQVTTSSDEDGGCACRTGAAHERGSALAMLLIGAVFAARRRTRIWS